MADDEADARILQCIAVDVSPIHIFFSAIALCSRAAHSFSVLAIPWEDGVIRNFLLFIYPFVLIIILCALFFTIIANKLGSVRCFFVNLPARDACARVSVSAVA